MLVDWCACKIAPNFQGILSASGVFRNYKLFDPSGIGLLAKKRQFAETLAGLGYDKKQLNHRKVLIYLFFKWLKKPYNRASSAIQLIL
jgi:hypothetical protein